MRGHRPPQNLLIELTVRSWSWCVSDGVMDRLLRAQAERASAGRATESCLPHRARHVHQVGAVRKKAEDKCAVDGQAVLRRLLGEEDASCSGLEGSARP